MSNSPDRSDFNRMAQEIEALKKTIEQMYHVVNSTYHETLFYLRKNDLSYSTYVGDHRVLTTISNGYRMYVDSRSRDIGVHLMNLGEWETNYTNAFKRMLSPGSKVLDVGANLGWYSMCAAPIVGHSGKVVAIEPNPTLADVMYASFEINGFLDFCHIHNVAAGEAPGLLRLVSEVDRPGHAYVRSGESHGMYAPQSAGSVSFVVPSVVLDDFMTSNYGYLADVIKMDIEGYEGVALKGLRRHLRDQRQLRMIIEWGASMDNAPVNRSATANMLHEAELRPFRVASDSTLVPAVWSELVVEPQLINIVLLRDGDPLIPSATRSPG